jgi:molybdopterin converting factor subunit 1
MKVKVKFFAILRERTGAGEIIKEIETGGTVADLWAMLKTEFPNLAPVETRLLFAVNKNYVKPDHALKDGDEVVFIPPVSGGSR